MVQLNALPAERVLESRWLLDELLREGRISNDDAERIIRVPRFGEEAKLHPVEWIAAQKPQDLANPGKFLTTELILGWLGNRVKQPYFHIDPLKINVTAITEVMSFAFAQRHRILALEVSPERVTIASAEPFVTKWELNLEQALRRPLRRVLAKPAEIDRYIVEFYSLAKSVRGATTSDNKTSSVTNFEQLLELGNLKDPDANDSHIVNIVDWLLQYAFDQRASDIHIEPRRDVAHMRFRIDGVLYNVYELPAQVGAAVIARIKIIGRMNVAEKRRPQDGRLKTVSPEGNEVELRLSTLPTAFGEKMVMRIFDPDVLLRSFKQLGLENDDYDRWQNMINKPNGIVLVTGPTGSGKTTTLYSSLKQLATSEVNLCTIEDPIEMVEEAFNQMQVQHNIDLDFASGVRALLRQDPDIIMIGEIRDLETAEMAIQAALTGHLVLSTLHTNDAPSALTRLLELGVPSYLLKATILGVMAQRLVRTLCPHCKQPGSVDEAAWQQLVSPWKMAPPKISYHPKGCLECRNTGYLGRQGIYEILLMSEAVQELINENTGLDTIRRQGMKEGMHTLRLSGAYKVAAGDTTIEEVMRVAPAAQNKA